MRHFDIRAAKVPRASKQLIIKSINLWSHSQSSMELNRCLKYFLTVVFCFCGFYANSKSVIRVFRPEGKNIIDVKVFRDSIVLKTDGEKYISFNGLDFSTGTNTLAELGGIPRHYRYEVKNGALYVTSSYFSKYSYPNTSIRTIQKNFLGTYQGVWLNNKRIPQLTYSSGKSFTQNDTSYICYDGVLRITNEDTTFFVNDTTGLFEIDNQSFSNARDLVRLDDYFLQINTSEILLIDPKYSKVIDRAEIENNEANCFLQKTLSGSKNAYLCLAGKDINRVYVNDEKLTVSRIFHSNFHLVSCYLTSNNTKSVIIDKENSYISLTAPFGNVHDTIAGHFHGSFSYDEKIFLVGNDGLFRLDGDSLVKLRSIEYNRGAIYTSGDTVKLGSTIGLFSYSLPGLAYEDTTRLIESSTTPGFTLTKVILVLLGLFVFLIIAFFLYRFIGSDKKTQTSTGVPSSIPENQKDLSLREQILDYIDKNLPTVSNKDICYEFGLSQVQLYNVFKDDTPGKVIARKRKILAERLFSEKKSTAFISEKTGYSENYLTQTVFPPLENK